MKYSLGVIFTAMAGLVSTAMGSASRTPAVSYTNVLIHERADPQILKHDDGWYYFTASVPEFDRVILRRSQTIQGLSDAEEVVVWNRADSEAGIGYVWAPEIHYIDDKWYIYFALGRTAPFDIRMFVIEGTGSNPLEAAWVEKGVTETDWDTFSLDATTFTANGTRYLCWAQADPTWEDGDNTSLMLAPLENPWTIRKPAVAISRPDLPWERIGHNVNEGAYVLERDGKLFMTYSASATDHNYAVGLLTIDADGDLMDPSAWHKSQEPVFVSNENTSQWGPGHNSFTVSEDGLSDIMVFHARQYRDIEGEPLNNPDRHARVQKLYWRADGTPDFGVPVPDGLTPVRFRSYANDTQFIKHDGSAQAMIVEGAENLEETQFRVVTPGLNGQGSVSLESTSHPGRYLEVSDGKITLGLNETSAEAALRASFTQHEGLADAEGVSFESLESGTYIQSDDDGYLIVGEVEGEESRGRATFYSE